MSAASSSAAATAAASDIVIKPVATLRHVALEPLHAGDQLGVVFAVEAETNALQVVAFAPVTTGAAGGRDAITAATGPRGAPVALFPHTNPHSLFLASIDPARRLVTLFYHAWVPYW